MIIYGHNEAVWELHKTICADTQGLLDLGGHFTTVDAGRLDHDPCDHRLVRLGSLSN